MISIYKKTKTRGILLLEETKYSEGFKKATGKIDYCLADDIVLHLIVQKNNRILKGLICSLMGLDPDKVESVVLLNPIDYSSYDGKEIILDVKVIIDEKHIVNVELQMGYKYGKQWWINRSLLYLCRSYDNIDSGDDYRKIKPTTHIGIVTEDLFKNEKPEFYARYKLLNIRTHKEYTGNFSLNMLYLNQIDKATKDDEDNNLVHWAKAFKATSWEELRAVAAYNEMFREVGESVFEVNAETIEREMADAHRKYVETMATIRGVSYDEGYEKAVDDMRERIEYKDAQIRDKDAALKDKDAQLYFIGVWHGCVNMYAVDKKGDIRQLTEDWADWVSIASANNGNKILAIRQSFSAPNDIYVVTPGFKKKPSDIQQITYENKHITDQLTFGKVQQRWVKTSDGKEMLTWIILPSNFDPNKKYPTLLFCEGGPQSPVSQFWSYRWNFQIMAANGYVIVAPNRRGLPGFGQEWLEEISGDWTGQCMNDYLSAIDDAANNLPFVDKDRLGAVGASFGGFSVYYLAGMHEKRFKAFIAHDGAFNLAAMYLETEENWFSNWEYDEAYWHRPQLPNAKKTYHDSPHKMVEKWDTPILCIHGEKDYRINYTQGMQAFNAARMKGIPAELLIFPDENHWVLKPQNGVLWQRTFFNWLDRWLKTN